MRESLFQKQMPHLEKYCRILTPSSEETWKDYTVFKTVTWIGRGAQVALQRMALFK